MARRPAALLLSVASLLAACGGGSAGGPTPPAPDGNDTFATAQAVVDGSTTAGVITSATDEDWYALTTPGAGTVAFTLGALTADADLELYDSAQLLVASSSNSGTATDSLAWSAPAADTFRVRVVPVVYPASYDLAAAFSAATPSDGNDTFATAQAVAIPSTTAGLVSSATDEDWYAFTTTGAGSVSVTLGALTADANLELYDSSHTLLASSTGAGTATEALTWTAAAPDTFRVRVVPVAFPASYALATAFVAAPPTDGNDTFATAQGVALGSVTNGVVSTATDHDWYSFPVPSAGVVFAALTGLSADADLELVDAGQAVRASSANAGTADEVASWTSSGAGSFYAHVVPRAAGAGYALTVAFVQLGVADGNDTFGTAQAASPGTILGAISSNLDEDWYAFRTPGGGTVTATLDGLMGDADLELYGELSYQLVSFSYFAGTHVDAVTYTAASPVTYHVRVIPKGAITPYRLTLAFTP